MSLIYPDTGVLLALAQGDGRWHAAAVATLGSADVRIVTSDMIWLEVLPSTHGPRGAVLRDIYAAVFQRASLHHAVDVRTLRLARSIAESSPVGGADAIHAAAALLAGAAEFVTTEAETKPLHAALPRHGLRVRRLGVP
ncbi:MAG: PIN domain-containing protein [Acetobacteraceae bacterium]|nr:PIN domain-containing protein [Acetobacteraceae bacterium]